MGEHMTEILEALMAAVVDAPEDRATWLVLADALEEAGRSEEANLIRSGANVWIHEERVIDGDLRTYLYREDGGYEHSLEASDMEEACDLATALCASGDWGIEGASVNVSVIERDATGEVTDSRRVNVEIEPNHEALIQLAGGDPECDHDWTSENEGGWNGVRSSYEGTSMSFASHCRMCGLHRVEHRRGAQRDPGDHDTVEYHQPSSWCVECQQAECECESEEE